MFELGSIFVSIGADTSRLQGAMRAALGDAARLGQQAGQAFGDGFQKGGLFNGIQNAINRFSMLKFQAREVFGLFESISGVKIAAAFQGNTVAFTDILGDAGKAQTMVRQLMDLAARTPFDTAQTIGFARQLATNGVAPENLVAATRTVADVAAAKNLGTAGMGRLTYVLGQVGTGGIQGDDVRQFKNAFVSLPKTVAAATGKNVQTPQEAMAILRKMTPTQQQATLLKGLDKLHGGMAEKMGMSTYSGVMQNLQERWEMIMLPTGQLLIPMLTKIAIGFQHVARVLQTINEWTAGFGGFAALLGGMYVAWRINNAAALGTTAAVNQLTASITALGVSSNLAAGATARGAAATAGATGLNTAAGVGATMTAWGSRIARFARFAPFLGLAGEGMDAYQNRGTYQDLTRNVGAWALGRKLPDSSAGAGGTAASSQNRHLENISRNTENLKNLRVDNIGGGAMSRQGSLAVEYALARSAMTGVI